MSPDESWELEGGDAVEDLMAECLALPRAERSQALERACAQHPDVAAELRARWRQLGEHGFDPGDEPGGFPEHLGEFHLRRRLGGGGMGMVFLADQPSLQREVALKIIRPEYLFVPGARERFRREVESIARLRHPAIVPVYSVGEDAGTPFFVMEYVAGCTLEDVLQLLRQRPPEELTGEDLRAAVLHGTRKHCGGDAGEDTATSAFFQGTWVQVCLRVAREIALALAHAHFRGVLHRDIKPSNVLLTPQGRVLLVDFGLASTGDSTRITRSGSQVGSLLYMAPEQARGTPVDERADVYSLGIVLYELLSLHHPYFAESTEATRARVLAGDLPALRSLNRGVPWDAEIVCQKAADVDPGRRYAGAAELARDLQNVLELRSIEARAPGPWLRLRRWVARHPTASVAMVLGAVTLLGGPVAGWVLSEHARGVAQEAQTVAERRLADWLQIADVQSARALLEGETELYPAFPASLPRMEEWLREADRLVQRRGEHEAMLARLAEGREAAMPDAEALLARDVRTWQAELLRDLLGHLDLLQERIPWVRYREEIARSVSGWSIESEEARAAWEEACGELALSERYGELEIDPVLGLFPLGPDPDSGLWEFWHVLTGPCPSRDPDTGAIVMDGEAGMVLVLLPGATFLMGAEPPSPGRPAGSPHVDPASGVGEGRDEGPVHEVTLEPFFLSKFEMTQGQWIRATGRDPSELRPSLEPDNPFTTAHPVEHVTEPLVRRVLRELALVLPTEAQWEYAARAGTTTVYWTGNEPRDLRRHENVASLELMDSLVEPWSDGFAQHAPVGSYPANPFGFHDVLGNVAEWTADALLGYSAEKRPGDGLLLPGPENLVLVRAAVLRGGSWGDLAVHSRVARRRGFSPEAAGANLGVRPAMTLPGREPGEGE